jgi:hypothetical protein
LCDEIGKLGVVFIMSLILDKTAGHVKDKRDYFFTPAGITS